MTFRNRVDELARLERWWDLPRGRIGMVWGRRRVGKTALLQRFAEGRRTIFHTATGRPPGDELRTLSMVSARQVEGRTGGFSFPVEFPLELPGLRDLKDRPFSDWIDALETLADAAVNEPLLLVLDEFPELIRSDPSLATTMRATWDRVRDRTQLRILLAGSAVRVMEAMPEERAPLYGRLDLSLLLHPFRPHEAALMLQDLAPPERAVVWGIVGGVPLYLDWWDQTKSVRDRPPARGGSSRARRAKHAGDHRRLATHSAPETVNRWLAHLGHRGLPTLGERPGARVLRRRCGGPPDRRR